MDEWARAFALTLLVELPLYGWLLKDAPLLRRLLAGLTASSLTHPWLWFILPAVLMPALGYWGYVAVGEALVVLAEAGVVAGVGTPWRRALRVSVLVNAASFAVGQLLDRLW